MLALIETLLDKLSSWEKLIGALAGISASLLIFWNFFKKIFKNIRDANRALSDFLNIIPKLKVMVEEFGPTNSLRTTLQRVENKLYCNDQQIKVVASCIGVAGFETNEHGLYTFVSKKWSELTGLTSEEAIGNGWLNIVDDDVRESIYKEWTSCVSQNREFHTTFSLSNSENKEVSVIALPIRNLDGSIEKFFGILI